MPQPKLAACINIVRKNFIGAGSLKINLIDLLLHSLEICCQFYFQKSVFGNWSFAISVKSIGSIKPLETSSDKLKLPYASTERVSFVS